MSQLKYKNGSGQWVNIVVAKGDKGDKGDAGNYSAGNGILISNDTIAINEAIVATVTALANKVDKVTGKSLSTNDFTNELKTKLENIDTSTYALVTESGKTLEVTMDSSSYVMTFLLKDKNGNTLSTQTIDLPLESMIVSGEYDSVNKKIKLTLKSGDTIEFSVADLVSGLQTEITSANKLSSDLVDDTASSTHKFVTADELLKIADNTVARHSHDNKETLDSITAAYTTEEKTKLSGIDMSTKQNVITSSNKLSADLVDDSTSTNKFVTEANITTWNNKQDILTFDSTPIINSSNPVTSNGIKVVVDNLSELINPSVDELQGATLVLDEVYEKDINEDITFVLPTVPDDKFHQVLIFANVSNTSSAALPTITWGTTKFFNGKIPTIKEGLYNFIFEYNGTDWYAGTLSKGAVSVPIGYYNYSQFSYVEPSKLESSRGVVYGYQDDTNTAFATLNNSVTFPYSANYVFTVTGALTNPSTTSANNCSFGIYINDGETDTLVGNSAIVGNNVSTTFNITSNVINSGTYSVRMRNIGNIYWDGLYFTTFNIATGV